MLTKEAAAKVIGERPDSDKALDGRDQGRFLSFCTFKEAESFASVLGVALKEDADEKSWGEVSDWTEEGVKKQLADDVAFGFKKAINQRGLSAEMMYHVVKMWMLVLEDEELAGHDEYAQYGLPLFKAVAVKYGLPNEIGEDHGNEDKYAA